MSAFDAEAHDRRHRAVATAVDHRGEPVSRAQVGGLDAAYPGPAVGAAVVWDAQAGDPVERAAGRDPDPLPYVPGYLFARELPALAAAVGELDRALAESVPWLVDGHGLLHPKRAGLACHVGVSLGLQTVGVGKSPLVAEAPDDLGPGEAAPLEVDGEVRGYAYRPTAEAGNPVYISSGHRIGPREALELVRGLCRTRVPEPVRAADAHASRVAEGRR